jgi:dephospho-CoA kinase
MPHVIIGLTGGIATGKSTVLAEMKRLGCSTISSDVLVHRCLQRDHPAYQLLLRHFGKGILDRHGQIDRALLGKRVFQNKRARRQLESVIHPYVITALRRFAASHRKIVVLDIPLLFEAHLQRLVDLIVVVSSTRAQQIKRLQNSTNWTKGQIRQRLCSQWALARKRRWADRVIHNTGTIAELKKKVRIFVRRLATDFPGNRRCSTRHGRNIA